MEAHPGAVDAHPGDVDAHPEAMKCSSGVIEPHPGAVKAYPGAVDTHLGAMKAHHGDVEARTDKKENQKFSSFLRKFRIGAVAKSYMRRAS